MPRDICDLILWFLVKQADFPWRFWLRFAILLLGFRGLLGREESLSQGGEGVRGLRGFDNCVPYYGFTVGRVGGGGGEGWIGGEDVDEELFCVPVEEGG